MTGDLTKFTSLKLKAEGHVTYGDNNRVRILGRGTVGTRNSTTIENVLYVEGLKHSLLNISQLCDEGYKVNFKSKGCTISSDFSGKVLFTGKRVNNIYLLDIMETNSSNECLLSRSDESWLWHRRLAHIHTNHLNKLKSKDLVSGLPSIKFQDNRLCDACVKEPTVSAGLLKEWKTPRDLTLDNVIGNIEKGVSTRKSLNNFCKTMAFVSQVEPKILNEALKDSNWILAMQEELNQFALNEVWNLVPRIP